MADRNGAVGKRRIKYRLMICSCIIISGYLINNAVDTYYSQTMYKEKRRDFHYSLANSSEHESNATIVSENSRLIFNHETMTPTDRMCPMMLELLPDEIMTIPVWDKNRTLVDGGKNNNGACSYPILDSTLEKGRCCLGARSGGGGQKYWGAEIDCPQNLTIYRQVQKSAVQEMEAYPVTFENNPSHIKCDICRVINIVSSMKHKRISIVGDSVQQQLFHGFECELRRRHFDVSTAVIKTWPEIKEKLPGDRVGWKYGVKADICFNVTVPQWMNHNQHNQQLNQLHSLSSPHVEICHFNHYRPYPDMAQHMDIANSSDVMMINYGVHYLADDKTANEFEQSLESLLKVFDNSECLLMYRETSAQHFDNDGGEWSDRFNGNDGDNIVCTPITGTVKWRTRMFKEVAKNSGYSVVDSFHQPKVKKEVVFLPFFDWSSKLISLKDGQDCTHFCYTPHMWYPMWRHVRIALDRMNRT